MKKSNTPNGLSLSPEFKEVVKRIKNKEPELDELVKRDGELDRDRTVEHVEQEEGKPQKTSYPDVDKC
jgi:hypothetical protein